MRYMLIISLALTGCNPKQYFPQQAPNGHFVYIESDDFCIMTEKPVTRRAILEINEDYIWCLEKRLERTDNEVAR